MTGFLDVTDDSNVQVLGRCTNIGIGGISHNIGSNTGAVKGTVMDDLLQEVTVLVRNGDESIWYKKSNYVVNVKRQVGADGSVGFSVACFSGEQVMISIQNKGAVAIKDLSLGDHILVDNNKYEPIYSFGHVDSAVSVDYL